MQGWHANGNQLAEIVIVAHSNATIRGDIHLAVGLKLQHAQGQ